LVRFFDLKGKNIFVKAEFLALEADIEGGNFEGS